MKRFLQFNLYRKSWAGAFYKDRAQHGTPWESQVQWEKLKINDLIP
jgi:hypothetical protein